MIIVDLPASMSCVEKPCAAKLAVRLALGIAGNLMPVLPNGHGWQLTNAPNGAFVCRCPDHRRILDAPDAPKLDDLRLGAKH